MKVVQVQHAGGSYPVYIGSGLFASPELWLRHVSGRVLVVTDENVAGLHLDRIRPALASLDHCRELVLPAGEEHKTVENWRGIIDQLVTLGAQRDATVIALGGGMIGDMAGFAAASYMRGIRVVQMPTTLLAQVDAAIGGKTGVNHPHGKNLIGAFHQPAAVVAELDTLDTLESREYRAGLAEVVKYGAIRDPALFNWLERNTEALAARLPEALLHAVCESVRNKAEVVAADEREAGERALLNFGHTFGHALETITGYRRYRHGEAVAIGMVLAARLSERTGISTDNCCLALSQVLDTLGLEVKLPGDIDCGQLLELMQLDKKNRNEEVRLVLLKSLGQAVIQPGDPATIHEVLKQS